MKENKDIIDEIVNRLRSQRDYDYKEGAWEKFQSSQQPILVSKIRVYYRLSAAAALIILGAGIALWLRNETPVTIDTINTVEVQERDNLTSPHTNNPTSTPQEVLGSLENTPEIREDNTYSLSEPNGFEGSKELAYIAKQYEKGLENKISIIDYSHLPNTYLTVKSISYHDKQLRSIRSAPTDNMVLSSSATPINQSLKEVENRPSQSSMRLNERFDIAFFVSPNSTADKMSVGGGMLVAYNLNKKISLRTGASYNTYEMGVLKNPTAESSAEIVSVSHEKNSFAGTSEASFQRSMVLPNVNAVTGKVQSLDIPLELKYNFNTSLYAVAGVSYSAILNQERSAHYVENINNETFVNGYPENREQVSNSTKTVTRTVKSAETNVNSNGFNGFVTISVGKKVTIGNKFGISVEPYFKIPVGEYRRADMDYTNGGIRLMTTF
ncbi:outer membrane beta-barrel protein [Sphingobacterium lumbrici]|uniref:outer membrane beta-barrel protein n=1 Tax=Sphingobacterium lumbrici TaxID=2559600 RepID=UPI001127F9F5|nr:outer membrane beta-barrel protein [Sphingobacterium lumbrici]